MTCVPVDNGTPQVMRQKLGVLVEGLGNDEKVKNYLPKDDAVG